MIKVLIVIGVLTVMAAMFSLRQPRAGGAGAGAHLPSLSAEQFDEAVATGVVVVDFWAPWCGPCRQQLPILEELAQQVDGRASVVKVNVDEQPELAGRFGVRGIPTLLVMRDGDIVERFTGVQRTETLVSAIEQAAALESGGTLNE